MTTTSNSKIWEGTLLEAEPDPRLDRIIELLIEIKELLAS